VILVEGFSGREVGWNEVELTGTLVEGFYRIVAVELIRHISYCQGTNRTIVKPRSLALRAGAAHSRKILTADDQNGQPEIGDANSLCVYESKDRT
jgi:hypothetical protein